MKMKTVHTFFTALLLLTTTFLLSSCQDDEKSPAESEAAKKAKVEKVLAFREDLDFINRFVNDNVTDIPEPEGRKSYTKTLTARIQEIVPCAETLEEEFPDGTVKVTMDFGDGCETEEGVVVTGSVVMTFKFAENIIKYDLKFTNYAELNSDEHDGEVINGTVKGSFKLDLEASIFIQEMEQDLNITYDNNTEARYRVAQSSEMTNEGLRVTSLTTSGNFADEGVFTMTLTKALVYDFACDGDFPVQGEEILNFQGNTIKVNYGNGTCDKTYTAQ
ncbi:hypothetical protein [Pseudochryseolinea flava]|uniref:Lipoprotein n=1 Tax=Pseudochryseolinea flava TaxID=2059302 RepID=A0A364Y5V0_9BACT|nr:hypothetical protein [Pseudochryseolinea flava]RAW02249.1 hypothetical protein DQQ10_06820 [Pseudochryseolinea flava]